MTQQFLDPGRVTRIGQQTPPRRGGIPGDAVFRARANWRLRPRPLRFSSRSRSTQPLISGTVALRDLALNGLRSRSANPDSRATRFREPRFWLMGRCPRTSPVKRKSNPSGCHQGPGLPEHEGVAVDAGVVAPAPAVGRIIDEGQEFVGEIGLLEGQAQVGGRFPGPRRPEKRRHPTDEGDVDAPGPAALPRPTCCPALRKRAPGPVWSWSWHGHGHGHGQESVAAPLWNLQNETADCIAKIQIPVNPPLSKGDFTPPLFKRGGFSSSGVQHLRFMDV